MFMYYVQLLMSSSHLWIQSWLSLVRTLKLNYASEKPCPKKENQSKLLAHNPSYTNYILNLSQMFYLIVGEMGVKERKAD